MLMSISKSMSFMSTSPSVLFAILRNSQSLARARIKLESCGVCGGNEKRVSSRDEQRVARDCQDGRIRAQRRCAGGEGHVAEEHPGNFVAV